MNLIISVITLACVLTLFVFNFTNIDKEKAVKVPVTSSASSQSSSISEEKEEKTENDNLISLTPPDTAHTALLRTDKEGLSYLSNHSYQEGQQAARSYIFENSLELERIKDNSPDGVYYYVWVSPSFVYELEYSGLFSELKVNLIK